ncbi:MAG TPA: SBBP repeat-containing protein, partial [Candidatus Acidoferrum sp.]
MPSRFAARLWLFVFFAASIVISIPGSAAQEAKPKLPTLPLAFERNDGQTKTPYRFLVRRGASGTFFLADGMDVVVPKRKGEESRVRVRWVGSDPGAEISGTDRLPGYSNYLRGSEPSRWLRDVPQFAQVRYGNIYPGIDLLFHGNAESLEHDFILKPGADPSHISLRFDKAVGLTADGNLTVDLGETEIHFLRPQAYQESGGTRNGVPARFLIARNGDVHFKLGKYDHNKTLVIDPVFSFSTYLDGANADSITAVTTDSAGDVYVTGFTASSDFPITNAANPLCAQCSDASQTSEAFISKLDPTGHSLLFSTFLGGSTMGGAFGTFAGAIALDHNGNIIVAGASSSSDFPHAGAVLSLSPQSANSTFYFIASLKPEGSAFNYAGLVGGSQGSYTNGNNGKLAVDAAGNAYLSGTEDDANFQLTSGVLGPTPTTAGFDSMFVMKFDSAGKLVYSTLVPGTLPQDPTKVTQNSFLATGITVDSAGDVTIAGNGGPGLPVTPGALLSAIPNAATYVDPTAGLLLQLDPTASALNFATYLPGVDVAGGLAMDSVGNFYVTGVTSETNLPVGPSSYQKAIVPNADCTCNAGFVMKINPLAKSVLAATYLSGSSGASFRGIAVDSKSNVFVGGFAFGGDFPLKNPFVTRYQISSTIADTVVAQLDTNLTTLQFGSYLSGSSNPYPGSIFAALAIDPNDKPVVVGTTFATDYPTTAGSFQTAPPPSSNPLSSYQHTFISKLDLATPAPSVCLPVGAVNFPTAGVNTSESQTLTVTNCGNAPLQISTVTSSLPVVTAAQSCGSVAPGGNCNVQLTFTPVDTSLSQGTISLKDNAAITQQTIAFSGQGGLPNVIFPSAYQTADLLVGTRGESFLTLLNQGDANWVIKSITVTGDFT